MAGHCGQRQLYLVIYRINTIPNWLKLFALYNNIVKLQVWAWKPTVYDKCHSLVAIMSNSITHYIVFQRNTTSQTLWRRIAGARSCSSIWFINFELYSLWRQHIYPRVFYDNQLPAISCGFQGDLFWNWRRPTCYPGAFFFVHFASLLQFSPDC